VLPADLEKSEVGERKRINQKKFVGHEEWTF